ncbi:hypothetical protein B0T11DRAFT_283492 [Plectosphaerella cucumerina]|jgi:uncharacterized protein YbjT (DUF2867 family)|uniref:NmrA-like domain-containing protein n=1 Tax=Plectosphaerella cucumerina TaxID=40658 RepID=A0A8K0X220_9PEZI|nr:hypothetical protein B0T11DRAFT_283492 [Plectosphaerella cucumerina]
MASTILVVGATGNTGRAVVETLAEASKTSGQKIIALTRSTSGAAAQKLSKLPGVEVLEKNWVDITADWLRDQGIKRAFIASHNEGTQFADESTFHLAALHAGVEYVVRISTTAANVRPDSPAYYPRQHWAIEQMLASAPFKALRWTSLQPNVFHSFYLGPAVDLVKEYRKTGAKPGTLRLMADKDALNAPIHSDDVGVFAARLLLLEDVEKHNGALYELNGPEDITGEQVVKLAEEYIGVPIEDVKYRDLSFLDQGAAAAPAIKHLILSIKHAPVPGWEGRTTASTTSKEVLELAAPKTTPAEYFRVMVEEA